MELIKLEGVAFQIVNNSSCSTCEFKNQHKKDKEFPCRACKKEISDLAGCSIKHNNNY